jgi:hypothetical protein
MKGFEALHVALKVSQECPLIEENIIFLKTWTSLCIIAIRNAENRVYFWKIIGFENFEKELGQFLFKKDLHGLICGMAISLAVENAIFLHLEDSFNKGQRSFIQLFLKDDARISNVQILFFVSKFIRFTENVKYTEILFYSLYKFVQIKYNQVELCNQGFMDELLNWVDYFSSVLNFYVSVDPSSPVTSDDSTCLLKSNALFGKYGL